MISKAKVSIMTALVGIHLVGQGIAHNLGVVGSVYSIEEPDMLEGIKGKLLSMRAKGVLKREEKKMAKRSVAHVLRPKPVSGVSRLSADAVPEAYYFNPSIVVDRDIINANGDVIAKKGQHMNPFYHVGFSETLLFIDGDDPYELLWVRGQIRRHKKMNTRLKIILVKGDVDKTAKHLKHKVFFDQSGTLCRHFGIKHVPTMVSQPEKGRGLLIEEVRVG